MNKLRDRHEARLTFGCEDARNINVEEINDRDGQWFDTSGEAVVNKPAQGSKAGLCAVPKHKCGCYNENGKSVLHPRDWYNM